jgi:hypothetical protein
MILFRRFGIAGLSDDDDGYLKWILEVDTSSGKKGNGREKGRCVWNCGRDIIYCDKQRSGRMESKLNIISSDIILVAGCTADPQVSDEATTHMPLVSYPSYITTSVISWVVYPKSLPQLPVSNPLFVAVT